MVSEQIYSQLAEQIGSDNVAKISSLLGLPTASTIIIVALVMLVILIWSLIWKGIALWKSARKSHKLWFIILLILNTVGILEILYIYVFSKMDWNKKQDNKLKKKRKK